MSKPVHIVYAEPQPLLRAGLRLLIERLPGMEVVADVGDGQALLDEVLGRHPQLVVTELALPQISGIEAMRRLMRHLPRLRVLVLSAQAEASHVRAALRAGAAGYLSKSADPAELNIALRAVMRGETYLSPSVSRHAIERRRPRQPQDSVILSSRQREVLQLMGRGKSTKEIAGLMGLSSKTVETHRSRLMQALALNNINELVHFAVRHELEAQEQ